MGFLRAKPNTPPGAPVARTTVGSDGVFHLLVRLARYPNANARAARTIYIGVAASGAAGGAGAGRVVMIAPRWATES